ncbi:MAG: restriction endonuclease subunit S [Deltaproteobacteria bacterium]|nr:restriction endonuclease subunit S [Deltaproteobacteria bacterium]
MKKQQWPQYLVEDLFEVQLGKMLNEEARNNQDVLPYLANFNVQWGRFDFSRLNKMYFSEKEKEKFSLKKGDLLVCEGGEVGRCAIWREEIEPCFYQKALHRLRPLGNTISTEFMLYYLQFISSGRMLSRLTLESSIAHLTRETLLKVPVVVPPIAVQKRIVDTLSAWDTAIEKTERLITAKERLLRSYYYRLFVPPQQGAIGWKRYRANRFLRPRKEVSIPTGEMPLYSLTIEDGVTPKTDRYDREFLVKDTGAKTYKVVHPGDIVYNPANLRWGAIARSEVGHKVVVSPIYEVLEVDGDSVNPDLLTHALTCPRQIGIFATKVEGTLIERMAVKLDTFLLTELVLPIERSNQDKVAEFLNDAKGETYLLRALRENLRTQKRGLMRKLLTGEWRVKVTDTEAA